VFVFSGTAIEEPIVINDDTTYINLAQKLHYYFDQSRNVTAKSLLSESNFLPTEGRVSWGHRNAASWFRFHYISETTKPKNLNLKVLVTGFPWTIQPEERGTVLIFLDYPAGILSHAQLYSAESYKTASENRISLNALLLGIFLVLIFYNLIIYIWTREPSFLFYVLYVLSSTFNIYLRENYVNNLFPFLHNYYFHFPTTLFAILFIQHFLETKKNSKPIHYFLNVMIAIAAVFSVYNLFWRSSSHIIQALGNLYNMVGMIAIIGIIVYMIGRLKVKNSLTMLIAFLPSIGASIILQMEVLGHLQSNTPFLYFVVREGMYLASTFQIVILSIALADKINFFKARESLAQKEKKHLEEIDRIKTNFIMNVSHELRTPLTLIIGTIDNVISGKSGELIAPTYDGFKVIKRNAGRLLLMIDNLLKITRLEFKKFVLNKKEIALDPYLRFIFSEFDSLAKSRNNEFCYEKRCSNDPLVIVDLSLLETALLNVLANAFKFTPPGKPIRLILDTTAKGVVIMIEDSGPGISEKQRDSIFNRFFQTEAKSNRKSEGAGIGLSLAREALTAIGGDITFKNGPECGTIFSLILPDSGSVEKTDPVIHDRTMVAIVRDTFSTQQIKSDTFSDQPNLPKVLIVEDNQDLLDFLSTELAIDFSVLTAVNGIEALERLKQGLIPDLVISDVMMPEMDGIELVKEIRNLGYLKIPFLFLTARLSFEEKLELLEEGAIDCLYKPFSPQELRSKAHNIVRRDIELKQSVKDQLREKVIKVLDDELDRSEIPAEKIDIDRLIRTFATVNKLTVREEQVMALAFIGKSDKDIASELDVATSTVSNTLSRVYKKAGVSGRVELLRKITGDIVSLPGDIFTPS